MEAQAVFWDDFFACGSDLHDFARDHSKQFPDSFMEVYTRLLNRIEWERVNDPDYQMARELMEILASMARCSDDFSFSTFLTAMDVEAIFEPERWSLPRLDTARDHFWDEFFPHQSFLRTYALAHASSFPERFISAFIQLLDSVKWKRELDPGFEDARKFLLHLTFACVDVNDFTALERQTKRLKEKERKKSASSPLWKPNLIGSSVSQFWELFGVGRCDLRYFSASQAPRFPTRFTYQFIMRLDRSRWSHRKDPHYEVAKKIMARLAISFSKGRELECAFRHIESQIENEEAEKDEKIRAEESKEADMLKAEEARLKRLEDIEAEKIERIKQKERQEAFNKSERDRKKRETVKNQSARVGVKSIGGNKK